MIDMLPIVGKVMDLVALSAKDRDKVKALKQDLIYEIQQNRQFIADFLKRHKQARFGAEHASQLKHLLSSLPVASFERIRSAEIPMERFFSERLVKPTAPESSDHKGTKQYLLWMRQDKSLVDLLRRYYGRIGFLRHRIGGEIGRVDMRYLAFMLRVISSSLKK